MHLSKEISELHYCGLTYAWHEGAFLSRCQAQYALERLWVLVAGGAADWEDAPVLSIPAIDEAAVHTMFALQPGKLFWIPLQDVLPPGTNLQLDTDRLPALCQCYPKFGFHKLKSILISLDLVAATFILLSRWEELNCELPRDESGNVLETSRLSVRQNFLCRPVLDEWALVLRTWVEHLRTGWKAKPSSFRIVPTHDIDHLYRYPRWSVLPRRVAGAVVKGKRLRKGVEILCQGVHSLSDRESDPCFRAINVLARHDEAVGASGRFFFMTANHDKFDDGYCIENTHEAMLLQELNAAGHIVGWHPGYHAAENNDLFKSEDRRICGVFEKANKHVRMHYLRWRRHTSSWLQIQGTTHDYSWGMNTMLGFSCSTCQQFPIWDFQQERESSIIETPLIVQDSVLIQGLLFPQGLSFEEQVRYIRCLLKALVSRVVRVGGIYSFLTHNYEYYDDHVSSNNAQIFLEEIYKISNREMWAKCSVPNS